MELGGVLAGVAVGSGEADGHAAVDHLPPAVQHLAHHQLPGLLLRKGAAVGGPENPVAGGETAVSGEADNADGAGGAACGDGGD